MAKDFQTDRDAIVGNTSSLFPEENEDFNVPTSVEEPKGDITLKEHRDAKMLDHPRGSVKAGHLDTFIRRLVENIILNGDTLELKQNAKVEGDLEVDSNLTVGNNIAIDNDAHVTGNLTVTGTFPTISPDYPPLPLNFNDQIAEDLVLSSGTKTQRIIYCKDLNITGNCILKARTIWVEGNLTISNSVTLTISPLAEKDELYTYGYHPGLFAPGKAGITTGTRAGRGGFGGHDGVQDALIQLGGGGGAGLIGDGGSGGATQNVAHSAKAGGDGRNLYLNPTTYKGGNGGLTTYYNDGAGSGGGGGGCGGGSGGTASNSTSVVSNGGTGAEMIFIIVRGNIILGTSAIIKSTGTNAEAQTGGNVAGAGGGAGGTIILLGHGSSNSFGAGSKIEAKGGNGGTGYNYGGGGGGGAGGIIIVCLKSSTFPTIDVAGGSGGAGGTTGSGGANGGAGSTGYSNTIDMNADTHTLNGGEDGNIFAGWIMQFIEGVLK